MALPHDLADVVARQALLVDSNVFRWSVEVRTYTWYLRMSEGAIVDAVAFFDSIEFNDLWARAEPA